MCSLIPRYCLDYNTDFSYHSPSTNDSTVDAAYAEALAASYCIAYGRNGILIVYLRLNVKSIYNLRSLIDNFTNIAYN